MPQIPAFEVEFDRNGKVVDPQQVKRAVDGIAAVGLFLGRGDDGKLVRINHRYFGYCILNLIVEKVAVQPGLKC